MTNPEPYRHSRQCAYAPCGREFTPYANQIYCSTRCRELASYARRFTAKGLKRAPKFTMNPGKCRACGIELPVPRPNRQVNCAEHAGRAGYRARNLERIRAYERERQVRRRRGPAPFETRLCQHREEKDGPICGVEFIAQPRIDSKGINRGVHAKQLYCPQHRTPKAVARRRWLNRNVENCKRLQRNHRRRNLEEIRAKQRAAAKSKRARMAAILNRPTERLVRARITLAAVLTIKGMSRRAMRGQLYPKTAGGDRQYDSVNKLFREHQNEIRLEVHRLAALTEAGRNLLEAQQRQIIVDLSR